MIDDSENMGVGQELILQVVTCITSWVHRISSTRHHLRFELDAPDTLENRHCQDKGHDLDVYRGSRGVRRAQH